MICRKTNWRFGRAVNLSYLLDTCVFIWLASLEGKLSLLARQVILNPENFLYLSPLSVVEIEMQFHLGRLKMKQAPDQFVAHYRERHGVETLPFQEPAALSLAKLPPLHRDPFDRMLIAQAISEGLSIITPDAKIRQYPVRTIW